MKITFLGTGTSQGVPVIACPCEVCSSMDYRDKRLRSSVHLLIDHQSLVIDTGPDFRLQMLREKITRLDGVLFTHGHKDHIAGLDDVRAYNFSQGINMPVYGSAPTLSQLRTEFYYAFEENKYPGIPQLVLHEITDRVFSAGPVQITPLPVTHLHMPVLGFRLKDFSYITDANAIPESTYERLQGTRVLVLNALQKENHISHFSLKQAIEVAQRVGAQKTFFTHISHKLGLHKTVEKELPESIALAYDGFTIDL
jgi:phosphoribosyl 1,2-cyclic phosphate phosphodiesterase